MRVFQDGCSRLGTHAPRPFLAVGSQIGTCLSTEFKPIGAKICLDPTAGTHRPHADPRRTMIRSSPGTCRCRRKSAPGSGPLGPEIRASCPNRQRPVPAAKSSISGGARGDDACHRPQCLRIASITSATTIAPLWCPRFDERDDLHLAATLRTRQRVHFVHSLNQHRPGLAVARRCGLFAGWLGRGSASAFFRMPRLLLEYQQADRTRPDCL